MNFIAQESEQKLRGGFYTPDWISDLLCSWAVNSGTRSLLEPSAGDGSFLRALARQRRGKVLIRGYELDETECSKANAALQEKYLLGQIRNEDFLSNYLRGHEQGQKYDAVVGNPPYIRYQYLPVQQQAYAAQIFSKHSLKFTKHTNAWVPFVLASADLLAPGGRLAMALPAEILHIPHAQQLRQYLAREFSRTLILDPQELLFAEALQGIVLVLGEKKKRASDHSQGVGIIRTTEEELRSTSVAGLMEEADYINGESISGKWMSVFLTKQERELIRECRKNEGVSRFADIADVDVGIVTGANEFFLVTDEVVKEFRLQRFARPMFGRSNHVRGVVFDEEAYQENRRRGLPSNFLDFTSVVEGREDPHLRAYLDRGVEQKLPSRYKCAIRSHWYKVPSLHSAAVSLLKRAHNYPRLILNRKEALTTDTAYRITAKEGVNQEAFVYSFVNSLTCLSAELEGRHYGGGVLELVPSEIERLLVPNPARITSRISKLNKMVDSEKSATEVLEQQDAHVLGMIGLSKKDQLTLRTAWGRLRDRRQRVETVALDDL